MTNTTLQNKPGIAEAQLLLATLRVELTLQREVLGVHDRMKKAVVAGRTSHLEGQLAEDSDVLDRMEGLSHQREKILPHLFKLAGIRPGKGSLERLVLAMPESEQRELNAACTELRRVSKSAAAGSAALGHLIRHSIGVNQALISGVFGAAEEPTVYSGSGQRSGREEGAILNREI